MNTQRERPDTPQRSHLESLEPRLLLAATWPAAPFAVEEDLELYVNQNGDASVTGERIYPVGDQDAWSVFFDNSGEATFETTGSMDTEMAFYDGAGAPDLTDDDGGDNNNAKIPTTVLPWTQYLLRVAGYNDTRKGSYGMEVDGPAASAVAVTILPGTQSGSTTGNIGDTYDYDFCSFVPTVSGYWQVTVAPTGTSWDPTFNMYDSAGNPVAGDFTSPVDHWGDGSTERWTGMLSAGCEYFVRVDGFGGSTGNFMLSAEKANEWMMQEGSGDFNHDGHTDILWCNWNTGQLGAWLMVNGVFNSWRTIGNVPISGAWEIHGVGDFNNDTHTDILWQDWSTGQVGAWLMVNGVFSSWRAIGNVGIGGGWDIQGVGDFNNNGHSDILWHNWDSGQVGAWLMVNGVFNSWRATGNVAVDVWAIGVGDLNNDGHSDILWHNWDSGVVCAWFLLNATFNSYIKIGVLL